MLGSDCSGTSLEVICCENLEVPFHHVFASDKTKYSSYICSQPSDAQWLHQTASGSKGTIGDRISSSTLLIQSQPFLNVHLLGQLVELGKKEKRVSNMVCDR